MKFDKNRYTGKDNNFPYYSKSVLDILDLYKRKGKSMWPTDRVFYKQLKEQYPNLQKYTDKQILTFIEGFNRYMTEVCADYRDGVTLPANMGIMMICTFGQRNFAIDHNMSKQLGRRVHHKNDHSDGFGGGVYYSTYQTREGSSTPIRMYLNCELWTMVSCTSFRRTINKCYTTDWKKYHALPKSRRYADMIETYQKQLKTKKIVKQIKDTYNEFDFDDNENDD